FAFEAFEGQCYNLQVLNPATGEPFPVAWDTSLTEADSQTFVAGAQPVTLTVGNLPVEIGSLIWTSPASNSAGQAATVEPNKVTPSSAELTYQWYRDGVAIAGATSSAYMMQLEDVGHRLHATATATIPLGRPVTVSSAGRTVAKATPPTGVSATFDKTPTIGVPVTATVTWPFEPDSVTYQWQVGGVVVGANYPMYQPAAADQGKAITFTAWAYSSTYQTATITKTDTVRGRAVYLVPPSVTGTGIVGYRLSVKVYPADPINATMTYQWYRDETPISGATAVERKLVEADIGHQLWLRVTATASGYTSVTADSARVAVPAQVPMSLTFVNRAGPATFHNYWIRSVDCVTHETEPDTIQHMMIHIGYYGSTWSDYRRVGTCYWVEDVNDTVDDPVNGGHLITADQTAATIYWGTGQAAIGEVTMSGSFTVGSTVWAGVTGLTPAGATVSYQWFKDDQPIEGATRGSLTLTAADAGAVITVKATATANHYNPVTVGSWSMVVAPAPSGLAIDPFTVQGAPTNIRHSPVFTVGDVTTSPAGASLSYSWFLDGMLQAGFTGPTFAVTPSQASHSLFVMVTATLNGVTTYATSAEVTVPATKTVDFEVFNPTGSHYLAGDVVLRADNVDCTTHADRTDPDGKVETRVTLHNTLNTWADQCLAVTAWRTSTSGGSETALAFTLGDQTGVGPHYLAAGETAFWAYVGTGPVLLGISGIEAAGTAPGSTISVSVTSLFPRDATLSYQWQRDGAAIPGATSPVYQIQAADAAASLTCTVTAVRAGFDTTALTTAAIAVPAAGGGVAVEPVAITGTGVVGQALSVSGGATTPADATKSYQWLMDGNAIGGATAATFTVTTAQAGHQLTVRVVGAKAGLAAGSQVSQPFAVPAVTTISGVVRHKAGYPVPTYRVAYDNYTCGEAPTDITAQQDQGVTAAVGALQGFSFTALAGQCYRVQVLDAGNQPVPLTYGTQNGSAVYLEAGARHVGLMVGLPRGYLEGLDLDGNAFVGAVVFDATYPGAGITLKYQWYRGSQPIYGATGSQYQLQPEDIGQSISYRIDIAGEGYESGWAYASPYKVLDHKRTAGKLVLRSGQAPAGWTWEVRMVDCTTHQAASISSMTFYRWNLPVAADGTLEFYGVSGYCYAIGVQSPSAWYSNVETVMGSVTASTQYVTAGATGWQLLAGTIPSGGTVSIGTAAQIEVPLAGTVSGLTPSGATVTGYQWLRDGAAIWWATNANYTPVADDVGHQLSLSVAVTPPSSAANYAATTVTSAPVTVQAGQTTAAVSLSGAGRVGSPVTATATVTPANTAVSYQWLVGGAVVEGAAGASYTPPGTAAGRWVSVIVTATRAGYETSVATASVWVAAGDLVLNGLTLSGTAATGSVLSVAAGSSPAGAALEYQWYRGMMPIAFVQGPSYYLVADDASQPVWACVTAKLDGYQVPVACTQPVTVAVGEPTRAVELSEPTVYGPDWVVGATATVAGVTTVPADATLTYQWYRAGTAVAGATSGTYLLTAADAAQAVYVRLCGSHPDYQTACVNLPSHTVPAVVQPPVVKYETFTLSPDLTGDGKGEVLAVVASSGALHLHPSKGDGTLLAVKVPLSSGLSGARVFGPGDWDGDKKADVITVDTAGAMWLYKGNGSGGLAARVQAGRGWSNYRIVPAGDLNGDGANDMLAIDTDGKLWLYAGNGKGGFLPGRLEVGHGWSGFSLYAAGDLNSDGKADILSVNASGVLYAYFGKGNGSFQSPLPVGRGWGAFTLAAGADLNGDGLADIVGRNDSTRVLYYYQSKGGGQFAAAKVMATGW
ncbi:MAG: VCBS repeat-containing protein, partial [Bifidobacteriaceae bacterium]|nr:VCBS repeat-containing protein [Bifidobacteriaceae bacterium]